MTDQTKYPDTLFLPPEAFDGYNKYLNIFGTEHVCVGDPFVEYTKTVSVKTQEGCELPKRDLTESTFLDISAELARQHSKTPLYIDPEFVLWDEQQILTAGFGDRISFIAVQSLVRFITESNMIEGIHRPISSAELEAYATLLQRRTVSVYDLHSLVLATQPDADLRRMKGMNVRVGTHTPPPGGPGILRDLSDILGQIESLSPFELYCKYETLHPFTDGNGRSGRALWLWRMLSEGLQPASFLDTFHYQALEAHDK